MRNCIDQPATCGEERSGTTASQSQPSSIRMEAARVTQRVRLVHLEGALSMRGGNHRRLAALVSRIASVAALFPRAFGPHDARYAESASERAEPSPLSGCTVKTVDAADLQPGLPDPEQHGRLA
jgi:hypothetical protein